MPRLSLHSVFRACLHCLAGHMVSQYRPGVVRVFGFVSCSPSLACAHLLGGAHHTTCRAGHNRTALSDATLAASSSTILAAQAPTPAFYRSSSIPPSSRGCGQLRPLRRLHPSCPRPKVESCAVSSQLSLSTFSYFLVFFFTRERVISVRHHRYTSAC